MVSSDLDVRVFSQALAKWQLDVVVSGSIAAVESVRFVRCLRRLGAEVTPWLTAGGAQFITPTALEWAAGGRAARRGFEGTASHIATGSALILAPASASLIAKIAHGLTDSPAAALVASYLGRRRPVILVANMHDSLYDSPFVQENLNRIKRYVSIVAPRLEEGKHKFPDPAQLADEVAHLLNHKRLNSDAVAVAFGSTRAHIDDVRYLSNYSSGKLGSLIAEELYRYGHPTYVVKGACPQQPRTFANFVSAESNATMQEALHSALASGAKAVVLAASILDYEPVTRLEGKLKSADKEEFSIHLRRMPKIIGSVHPSSGVKVGFKLEVGLTLEKAKAYAATYMPKYQLSLMVLNDLSDVSVSKHLAFVFSASDLPTFQDPVVIDSKIALAHYIAAHVHVGLGSASERLL